MTKPVVRILAFLVLNLAVSAAQTAVPAQVSTREEQPLPATAASYRLYAGETEAMLRNDILGKWYPASIDKIHGGFHANFDRAWHPTAGSGKFSVFQGRMVWTAATVAERRPELAPQYLPYVRHGVAYLRDVLWDKQNGGFYWGLDDEGKVSPAFGDGKHLYGISFCIYGLAAAYRVTHDPATLRLAQQAFEWDEQHAHDAANGGYYEWLTRQGEPMPMPTPLATAKFLYGADSPVGYKSMNTHIHLLEAYTELYGVWKDDLLRRRVQELLEIVRDRIAAEPGAMSLYFTPAWQAVPDHDSYGHDMEVTYLLTEAAETLGQGADDKTTRRAALLTDHALAYGWDSKLGGVFHSGPFAGKPDDPLKEWWVQMESLNALLLLHERYGHTTDVYWKAFQRQWQWIRRYQVDAQFGGEYNLVRPDGTPVADTKGSNWKAGYHEARALLNVTDRLQRLAAAARSLP